MTMQIATLATAEKLLSACEVLSTQNTLHRPGYGNRIFRTVQARSQNGSKVVVEFWGELSQGVETFARVWA